MSHLMGLAKWIDRCNTWIGHGVAWLTLAMVLSTFAVVVLRYLFHTGWIALQEVGVYLHALVFMLAAAYTLRFDGHVRVDVLSQRLSPRAKAWIELLGVALLLWPTCIFLFWISWEYVAASWAVREGSREAGGLNGVWLLKGVMLALPVQLGLQGLAQVIHGLGFLIGATRESPRHREADHG
ncbi:MAG: TRAP transporter small permease subunit [Magnetococcales bacterium]|nr:TRAP transporter small permease subunit [Magnetococcales bacterium]